ncbi:MAG: hypothetical protein U1F45_19630 [Burkholderiales bacterium]
MPRLAALALIVGAAALAACDGKQKDSGTADLTRGGAQAMERAKDVAKTLEQGAARARAREDAGAADDSTQKGHE